MASQKLIETVLDHENYIAVNGITEEIINAYVMACQTAILNEKDVEYGLTLTARAKELIESLVLRLTSGTIWQLEKYGQDNNVQYDLVNKYYEVLKMESYERFESFIYYMERKRSYGRRFYQPRRKTLQVVVKDLEELDKGLIKFYGLSMPSRVGKSTICIFFLAWVAMKHP